jgi:hypothetical protein
MKAKKGHEVDWAKNIFNSLCSELDWWYKYVRENKGDKKDTYQFVLVLAKIFQYCLCIKRGIRIKHQPRFKKLRKKCK